MIEKRNNEDFSVLFVLSETLFGAHVAVERSPGEGLVSEQKNQVAKAPPGADPTEIGAVKAATNTRTGRRKCESSKYSE